MLRRRAAVGAWDAAMAPYWRALPKPKAIFTRFSSVWGNDEGKRLRALLAEADGSPGSLVR